MKYLLLFLTLLGCMIMAELDAQNASPSPAPLFDVVIKNGIVYDGLGGNGREADVAVRGDRIVGVGDFKNALAKQMIDARGLAVAPGFVNMLSWSNESLIADGLSQSEIRQGVTTEIMGEGESMGPVNSRVREEMLRNQKDIHYKIEWTTLADICAISKGAAFPAMSLRLLARPRFAKTSSGSRINNLRQDSSMKCALWSEKKWKRARLGSGLL